MRSMTVALWPISGGNPALAVRRGSRDWRETATALYREYYGGEASAELARVGHFRPGRRAVRFAGRDQWFMVAVSL